MKRLLLLLMFAVAAPLFGAAPALADGQPIDEGGEFQVVCFRTIEKQVDPIGAYGQNPSPHMHTFYGHEYIDEFSTPASIVGGPTACRYTPDSSGYWSPEARRTDTGAVILPRSSFAYYLGERQYPVETIPVGANLLAGDPHGTGPYVKGGRLQVMFECQDAVGSAPVTSLPYNCVPYGAAAWVEVRIRFPWCYDGDTPGDYHSFDYGNADGSCNFPFVHRITMLRMNLKYKDWHRGDLMTFSSGNGYTMHADFMNGWTQSQLNRLVANCMDKHVQCMEIDDANPGPGG